MKEAGEDDKPCEVKPVWAHLKVERSLQSPKTEATRDRDYRSSNPETDSRPARGNLAVLYIERKRVEGELRLPKPNRDSPRLDSTEHRER